VSVEFEPVTVGGGRRRFDPLAIGVVVVAVALVVAVVKPWQAGPPAASPGPSVAAFADTATTAPSAPPSAPPATAGPSRVDGLGRGTPPATWADVAPVVGLHDDWGVRAIVAERTDGDQGAAAGRRYAERWSPTAIDASGAESASVARGDSWVVALGVTAPRDIQPDGVRIWRVHRGDRLEWVDARPIAPGTPDGATLFVRIGMPGTATPSWRAGRYRIDLLADGAIRRVAVRVPDRLGGFPGPDEWQPTQTGLVAATASDPSGVRSGLFATVDGVGVPLAALPGRPLDEVDAWGATIRAADDGTTPDVARAYLPRATGLGVMLTEHAFVHLAVLQRLAPDPLFPTPPSRGGISSAHGRTPFVMFPSPDDEAVSPGVYAVSVSWTDPAGLHAVTWHVELRPGPLPGPD